MDEQALRNRTWVNRGIAAAAGLSLVFLLLHFVGFGQLVLDTSSDQAVFINGNRVTERRLKLRPGVYDVVVRSARYELVHKKVRVNMLLSKTFKPVLRARNPDEIVGAAIGSYGFYGPPGLSDAAWFENNTWLAGIVGPGSSAPIALHYVENQWRVGYFESTGYPKDARAIPSEVAAYLAKQLASESPQ